MTYFQNYVQIIMFHYPLHLLNISLLCLWVGPDLGSGLLTPKTLSINHPVTNLGITICTTCIYKFHKFWVCHVNLHAPKRAWTLIDTSHKVHAEVSAALHAERNGDASLMTVSCVASYLAWMHLRWMDRWNLLILNWEIWVLQQQV